MDAFQSRFAQTLFDNLEKMIVENSKHLIDTIQPDYASYRQQVGFIKGLQQVLKEARALETDFSRPENKTPPVHLVARQSYEA